MNIKENTDNIYIEDYIIPKGMEKADIKTSENVGRNNKTKERCKENSIFNYSH